jgi:hypothetical protein
MSDADRGDVMNETDDRLAGDPVWEIFAPSVPLSPRAGDRVRRYQRLLVAAGLIGLAWFVSPPAAVLIACTAVAAPDVRRGWQVARSIPDKAGGTICARFTYAWGAWKLGVAAIVLMFVSIAEFAPKGHSPQVPASSLAALLLCMVGFTFSAALTASGLLAALRSGMRVWIGEGVNQARTLLFGMLLVGFVFAVLGPMCVWLSGRFPRAGDSRDDPLSTLLPLFGCMLGGAVGILVVLEILCRRVIADHPSKFGPKVPTVGKWDSPRLSKHARPLSDGE